MMTNSISAKKLIRGATAPVRRFAASTALIAVATACSDREVVRPPEPGRPPTSTNAWLQLSDSLARPGQTVVISALARIADADAAGAGGAIGSFTARLAYDSLMLSITGVDSLGDGALRAVNPVTGEYRIAGASASGLRDGVLFRLTAQVRDSRGLQRIGLLIDELHSTNLSELTRNLEVRDGRTELLLSNPDLLVDIVRRR
ncbi:MAG: hypothetical protein ACT4OZ_16445 [Gemmatimonadota bacterium]